MGAQRVNPSGRAGGRWRAGSRDWRAGARDWRATARRWRLVRAHTDAVPASVRRFNQRARRRRWRAAAPWLVGLGAALLCTLAGWLVYGTPLLGADRVLVQGVEVASPDDVRAAAAIRPGTPLARLDPDVVARRVGALPAVLHTRVVRDWPRTVIIVVTERVAFAAVPDGSGYSIIDVNGVVFDHRPGQPHDLPLVRLSTPGPGDRTTRAALAVLAALTPQLRDQLVAVVGESPTRIRLELSRDRLIIWGDATENEKKARVATSLLKDLGRSIDVSAPDVVTVG